MMIVFNDLRYLTMYLYSKYSYNGIEKISGLCNLNLNFRFQLYNCQGQSNETQAAAAEELWLLTDYYKATELVEWT